MIPPAWIESAACVATAIDPNDFFSDRAHKVARAKALCMTCPVRLPCLTLALETDLGATGYQYGVFGGMVPAERRAYRKALA